MKKVTLLFLIIFSAGLLAETTSTTKLTTDQINKIQEAEISKLKSTVEVQKYRNELQDYYEVSTIENRINQLTRDHQKEMQTLAQKLEKELQQRDLQIIHLQKQLEQKNKEPVVYQGGKGLQRRYLN